MALFKKLLTPTTVFFTSLLLSLVAFAQAAATPAVDLLAFDPSDPGSVAKMLMDAVMKKQWGIVASLALTAVIAGLRKWTPEASAFGKWMRSKLGALITNFALALGTAFLTLFVAGEAFNFPLVVKALSIALGASGGWSIFKAITEAIAEKKAQTAGAAAVVAPTDTLNK